MQMPANIYSATRDCRLRDSNQYPLGHQSATMSLRYDTTSLRIMIQHIRAFLDFVFKFFVSKIRLILKSHKNSYITVKTELLKLTQFIFVPVILSLVGI